VLAPSISGDPEERARWARFERLGSNPAAVRAVGRMISQIDLRPVLAQVRVPTLILHASRDVAVPPGTGRYLAEHIAGAKYVEYDTPDHVFWIHPDPIADAIQEFLTGTPVEPEPDRVLAAVAFIDVARSTERAAQLGDAAWVQLLERYRALARRELSRFGGQQLDEAGDGILAAFDGPARAVRWAAATRDAVRALGIEVRAGVHVGECERVGAKLGGIAVHIGARVAELAAPGEVIVSGTVVDLIVGSGLRFEERGTRALRGVPGEWRLLALRDRD
jgi:class 3 adenylate cyclase